MRAGGHYSLFINILCEVHLKKKKNLKVDETTGKRKGDERYSLSPLSLLIGWCVLWQLEQIG